MTSYGPIITSERKLRNTRNEPVREPLEKPCPKPNNPRKKSAGIIEEDKQDQEEYFEGSIGDDSEYEDDDE